MKKYKDIAGDGGSNIVGQVEAQQAKLQGNLAAVRALVAVVSGKGGVGKSSVTAGLACAFALGGARVGVLDADLNGPAMAKMLGVRGQPLTFAEGGVEPPRTTLGVKVMSMDLLLPSDVAPLTWEATTQAEAHGIRTEIGAANLKVQMDLYHAQIVEGDLSEKIRRWLPHIGHIQIAGVPGRHEPDVGEINYEYLFRLLDDLKYDGWIGCEYRPSRGTTAGLTWLYKLLDRRRAVVASDD